MENKTVTKQLFTISNLPELIEKNLLKVNKAELQYTEINETTDILPNDFVKSLTNYANSGIFADSINFYYLINENDQLVVFTDTFGKSFENRLYVLFDIAQNTDFLVEQLESSVLEDLFIQKEK